MVQGIVDRGAIKLSTIKLGLVIAHADINVLQAAAIQLRQLNHSRRNVEPDHVVSGKAEELRGPSRTNADIQQPRRRLRQEIQYLRDIHEIRAAALIGKRFS